MHILQQIFGEGLGYFGLHLGIGTWLVENWTLVAIGTYLLACVVPAYFAHRQDRSFGGWLLLSLYITPIATLIVLLIKRQRVAQ